MRCHPLWIAVLVCGSLPGFGTADIRADDPITMWQKLSPQQQAEVEKTLTVRLPKVLGDDLGDYGKMLATEIPRWVNISQQLEAGDYVAVLGEFQGELTEFVISQADELLPEAGFVRWVFDQAVDQADALRNVAVVFADPTQDWIAVRDAMFDEVNSRLQDASAAALEKAIVYVINEVVGNPETSLEGYSTGELYILAVAEWTDLVKRLPELFEREAVNEMYQIYRVERLAAGREAAWELVRHQWMTERVTDPQGRGRKIRSWSARMTRLSEKFKVPFDQVPDKLLTLFDEYWETPRGQDTWEQLWDTGCHGWMEQRLRGEIESVHADLRREAGAQIEQAKEHIRARLVNAHRLAAAELHAAIEQQLTDQQRAERDAAIQEARVLVDIMLERNVQPGEQECTAFIQTVAVLAVIDERAEIAHEVLYDGLADEINELRQRVEALGRLAAGFEKAAAAVLVRFRDAESAVVLTEQTAQETCQSAAQVATADSKDNAHELMLKALRTADRMQPLLISAYDGLVESRSLVRQFEGELRTLQNDGHRMLQGFKSDLHRMDDILATLHEAEQLRGTWEKLYASLRDSAGRQQIIMQAFEAKKSRVIALLAGHHANHQTAELLSRISDDTSRIACLANNIQVWESRWKEAVFPSINSPELQELQQVRDLLASHPQLLQWASGSYGSLFEGLKPLNAGIEGFSPRLEEAELRAGLCGARAIVDYNRAWNTSAVPGISEQTPAVDPAETDIADAVDSITRVPVTTDRDPADDELEKIAGSITRVPAGTPARPQPAGVSPEPSGAEMPENSGTRGEAVAPAGTAPDRTPVTPGNRDALPAGTRPPEPFYAVYKLYGVAPPPTFSGSNALQQMQRWLTQLNAANVRISETASGEFSFLVTGKLLEEYADHQRRLQNREVSEEHPLFRQDHCYHQIGTLTVDGRRLPYPVLLKYSHSTSTRPASQVPPVIQPTDRNWHNQLRLEHADGAGKWSIRDDRGSRLDMGPLVYSGADNWSMEARTAAAEFWKRFALGMMQN